MADCKVVQLSLRLGDSPNIVCSFDWPASIDTTIWLEELEIKITWRLIVQGQVIIIDIRALKNIIQVQVPYM